MGLDILLTDILIVFTPITERTLAQKICRGNILFSLAFDVCCDLDLDLYFVKFNLRRTGLISLDEISSCTY